jgi:hypothetical protein
MLQLHSQSQQAQPVAAAARVVTQSSFTLQEKQQYEARVQGLIREKAALENQIRVLKNEH